MHKTGWTWAIALVLMLEGCLFSHTPVASTASEPALSLFANADGRGALTIRINDHRFQSQSLDDATSDVTFDAVVFRLYNTAKLRSPMAKAVAKNADGSGVYQAVFTDLPADGANGYYLNVGLFRGIVTPTNLADAGYQQLPNKVGEGVSSNFSILPGQTANTTVTVNAVGDLGIDSQKFVVDPVTPVLYPSDDKAFVDTRISVAKDPLADSLWLYVLDASETATQSTTNLAHASWAAMTPTATLSFAVPPTPANYYVCAEARDTSNHVLSRRYRAFTVASEALVGMDLTAGASYSIQALAGCLRPPAGRLATQWAIVPTRVAEDAAGNFYLVDQDVPVVWRVATGSNQISLVAGNGFAGYSGDGGPATEAMLNAPDGIVVDPSGNLFISDTNNNRVRKVAAGTGIITTVAGNGTLGSIGDGGPAPSAELDWPEGLAIDGSGNLYIADSMNNKIRKVTTATGIISTVAGNGSNTYSGDGGAATSAALDRPYGVAVDATGSLYIADNLNYRVRQVAAGTGVITTVAGTGTNGFSGDGGAATSANVGTPRDVWVDASGNLFVADPGTFRVREVAAGTGLISTVAGNGTAGPYAGDGNAATAVSSCPNGVIVDPSGNLFWADPGRYRLIKVVSGTGLTATVAGNGMRGFSGDGGLAESAQLCLPSGGAVDTSGNLFIADISGQRVRKVAAGTGIVTTVAGNGVTGTAGDGGAATSAQLCNPSGVAVDGSGNLFIADTFNHRIRKVTLGTGIITTVAGTGAMGFSGDGGPATSAQLNYPYGVAVDGSGNVYIADTSNHRIRKVAAGTGVITTVAGTGTAGAAGDGGAATSAQINNPHGVAVDSAGFLLIADTGNHEVRRVTPDGVVSTVAGTGTAGFNGDGANAAACQLNNPYGVAVDALGTVFIADKGNHRVRKVNSAGLITLAGNGTFGASGDGGPAPWAALADPTGVVARPSGEVVVVDSTARRLRRVAY